MWHAPGFEKCSITKLKGRKISLVRPSCRLEDNIKMDVKYGLGVLTEFVWFRIGSSGGLW
jgi:hypothetical protein